MAKRLASTRIKNLKILIPLAAIAAICILFFSIDRYAIATFDLGQGKSVSIQASMGYSEVSRPLYFEVREGFFKEVNHGCLIDFEQLGYPYKYSVVFAENRSMVGVLVSRPYELSSELFIMCDLVSNKCWPCDANDKQGEDFFQRIQHDNPNLSRPGGLSP